MSTAVKKIGRYREAQVRQGRDDRSGSPAQVLHRPLIMDTRMLLDWRKSCKRECSAVSGLQCVWRWRRRIVSRTAALQGGRLSKGLGGEVRDAWREGAVAVVKLHVLLVSSV